MGIGNVRGRHEWRDAARVESRADVIHFLYMDCLIDRLIGSTGVVLAGALISLALCGMDKWMDAFTYALHDKVCNISFSYSARILANGRGILSTHPSGSWRSFVYFFSVLAFLGSFSLGVTVRRYFFHGFRSYALA